MGERDVARGQIELLASLLHPDSTNDIAPSPYNSPDLAAGLPESPRAAGAPGFRSS